jgi:hypothetical protein
MKLNALLLCRQHESLSLLLNTLDELGIDEEMCSSAPEALELLALGYYSALILYKPLVFEQVNHSLRAGRAFMRPDRRRSARQKTDSLVYLRFGDVCPLPALVLELSQDGLSVQAAEPIPAAEVPLRFILPGTSHLIEGTGEVMWADDSGRAGILFGELSPTSRRQLRQWLSKREPKRASRVKPAARPSKSRAAAPVS